jgi:monoterpene epsilon-lactone hydrolase
MASWQAYVAAWFFSRGLKRRRRRPRDLEEDRESLKPRIHYDVPANVSIKTDTLGGVPGEWVETANRNGTTLLYFHGGGYYGCSPETHRSITATFAQHGFRVFAADYRLAPEHPFPAAVEDGVAVYRGLLGLGIPATKIVLAGDSSGGGLALVTMTSVRDANISLPVAAALFSPWTDLAATGETVGTDSQRCAGFDPSFISPTATRYLAGVDPRNPLASPLYADLSHLPPLLIHAGREEVLTDDSTRFADRAQKAGVHVELKLWPVVPHLWQRAQGKIPEANVSVREAAEFLARQSGAL